MWARRQAGHQQPAASCGTGTAGGKAVHQHGSELPSTIAQLNSAPQRVQTLTLSPSVPISSHQANKIQQDAI